MEIKYLQKLVENPYNATKRFKISGISNTEINQLEIKYNNGKEFPLVLKELLHLSGDYCPYLDRGMSDSQDKMQIWVKNFMAEKNYSINRPFFTIDEGLMSGGSGILYIYLDGGVEDPIVYAAEYDPEDDGSSYVIRSLEQTLSQFINDSISVYKVQWGIGPKWYSKFLDFFKRKN